MPENSKIKPSFSLRSLLAVASASLILSGCGGVLDKVKFGQARDESPAVGAISNDEAVNPPQDVDAEATLVYQILLGEIAHQRGDIHLSAEAFYRAAKDTRDKALVKRATTMAIAAKQYDMAQDLAQIWAEEMPDDPIGHDTLGLLLLEKGDVQGAKKQLSRSVSLRKDQLAAAFQRVAEIISSRKGVSAVQKIAVMKSIADQYPKEADAQYSLAYVALLADDAGTALAAVNKALTMRPDWQEAALIKLSLLEEKKDLPALKKFASDFLGKYPQSRQFRVAYARALITSDDLKEATRQFKQVLKYEPDSAEAALAVGLLALDSEDYDEAEKYLLKVLELDDTQDQAQLYLGQVAEARKQYDKAIKWYGAVKKPELQMEARLRLIGAMANKGDVDGALKLLDATPAFDREQRIQVYLSRENILRQAGRDKEALEVLNKALKEYPADPDLLYSRGLIAANLHDIELAETDLREVLKLEPDNAHAMNALGYTLAESTDRYDEARQLITRALELRPGDPFILDSLGWVEYKLGNTDQAIELLRKAMKEKYDPEIAAHLSEALYSKGDRKAAKALLTKALADDPKHEALIKAAEKIGQ